MRRKIKAIIDDVIRMPLNRRSNLSESSGLHPGSLLIAHVTLTEPSFRQSVILLCAHSEEQGSVGVIVNRPLGQRLGDYDSELSQSILADVPLFAGGPLGNDQIIFTAWKWSEESGTFQLYFGIDTKKAQDILKNDSEYQIRGFLGHTGWSKGQLEFEIEQNSWIISNILASLVNKDSEAHWHELLCHEHPEMRLLCNPPDDPTLN